MPQQHSGRKQKKAKSKKQKKPPSPPTSGWEASESLKAMEWPEENLTTTADEGGGFYPMRLGERLDDSRFVIVRKLGWGGNSSVWLARDRKYDRHVALKVLSARASSEIEAGKLKERALLEKVTNASPLHPGFEHVVHLLDEFTFESFVGQHICFAMDPLSYSIPSFQDELDDRRLPLKIILFLVEDVLKGLEYLHDECKIIHSDLKPGNILLLPSDLEKVVMEVLSEDPAVMYDFPKTVPPNELPIHPVVSNPIYHETDECQRSKLHWVIADLGHAHSQGKHMSGIVQPYALRAPEVILGLGWGPAIDIWSLGCLMYELATGHWLFNPKAVDDIPRGVVHLAQMTQRTGEDHDDAALKQYEIREKKHDLKGMLKRATVGGSKLPPIESDLNGETVHNNGDQEVATFVRIMRWFLTIDPGKRPRAAEALLDPAWKDIRHPHSVDPPCRTPPEA